MIADLQIHRYAVIVDNTYYQRIVVSTTTLDIAEMMYNREIESYKKHPYIDEEYEIYIYDYDNNAKIKSYDSKSDVC